MTDFEGVHPALGKALNKRGYNSLTPVQNSMLEDGLDERDLLVSAQTGSGKTVAFGISMATTLLGDEARFKKARVPSALVIAPTRELALQVKRELEWLYAPSGALVASCVGGMDIRAERRTLERGPHIIVGTPGRLRDHIERGYLDTSELKTVVLDEADEMLDMGFRDELEYILNTSPEDRRTLLFSATVPKQIVSLARRYQNDAVRITTKEEEKQHIDIEYQVLTIAPSDRENAILNVLRFQGAKNAIVFCGTRAAVNTLTSRLRNRGFAVVALSGELSQNERSHALQALRDGRAEVCVATDVAARGIDLPDLELVIHADLPQNKDLLLHRSGRTGRAGRKGTSTIIVPHNWQSRVERLLRAAKIKATWGKPPSIADIEKRDRERFLANPSLNEEVKEDEQEFVTELLAKYSAEQIAAALIRSANTQKPAPEELLDTAPAQGPKRSSQSFKDGCWVSLSIGRKNNADPRWIIPMMCGGGQLTKRQIGSIRIHPSETHVELSPECEAEFFAAIGPTGKIEDNIVVTRLDGVPEEPEDDFEHRRKGRGGNSRNRKSGKHSWGDNKGAAGRVKKKGGGGKKKHRGSDGDHGKSYGGSNSESSKGKSYGGSNSESSRGKSYGGSNSDNSQGGKPPKRKKKKNKANSAG